MVGKGQMFQGMGRTLGHVTTNTVVTGVGCATARLVAALTLTFVVFWGGIGVGSMAGTAPELVAGSQLAAAGGEFFHVAGGGEGGVLKDEDSDRVAELIAGLIGATFAVGTGESGHSRKVALCADAVALFGGEFGGVNDVGFGGAGGVAFAGAVAAFAGDAGIGEGPGGAGVALEAGRFDGAGELRIWLVLETRGSVPFLGRREIGQGCLKEQPGAAEEIAAADVAGADEVFQLPGGFAELKQEGRGDARVGEVFFERRLADAPTGLGHAGLRVLAGNGGVATGTDGVARIGKGGERADEEEQRTHLRDGEELRGG